jgi:hypothetical protein
MPREGVHREENRRPPYVCASAKSVLVTNGRLLDQSGTIVVPANCTKVGSALGITGRVYAAYPEANTYIENCRFRAPSLFSATAVKRRDAAGPSVVVSVFGQYNPGKPDAGRDSARSRLGYFRVALSLLDWECRKKKWTSVSFPANLFCGVAGGVWAEYEKEIHIFASRVPAQVYIVEEG